MAHAFENRVALVTGGSTGIGAAAARRLAEGGASVLITGRNEATLRASAQAHAKLDWLVADVANPRDAERTLDAIASRHGRLDILVNNAGVLELAPLADADAGHVERLFATNVFGLIALTRLALPLLRKAKGAIVNVATVVADQPLAGMSVYCASKGAVLALTRAWAQELAAEGVRVNAVSPGPIETPMFSAEKLKLSAAQLEQMGAGIVGLVPARRFGTAEEVAQVIAFLASSAASYVTGAQYTVAGGMEA